MDIYEALYTTRIMRRMKPDPIPLDSQCRILDAAIRAPNGGNTQRWHFLVVDDAELKARLAELYKACRSREYADAALWRSDPTTHEDTALRTETLQRIKKSGDYFVEHFTDIPMLLFVFAIDDHGGANIYPAIWSSMLAARAEGIGTVLTTMLRYEEDAVLELLGVPREEGWHMTAMLAFGYPLGRWGVASNRRPVHEVSSRNRWGEAFGTQVPHPLWPSGAQAGADAVNKGRSALRTRSALEAAPELRPRPASPAAAGRRSTGPQDRQGTKADFLSLHDAVAELIHDGDIVAMEGFTHLIPFAAAHEIIRQGITDLTLVRMTPDVIYDQLIGAGLVRKLVFSWGGNPGVGSLHRFRDAVENGWPRALELDEHSHAGMANRYVAGASRLPFAVLRGYRGSDLATRTDTVATVVCPFTGEELAAVAAINPDVTVIHAQQADRKGNVRLWGLVGVQKEAALSADRVLVTVEEIVDELAPRPDAVTLPAWAVTAVAEVAGGAHPSYAAGYSVRDNDFYIAWDPIARDRDAFQAWIREHVLQKAATVQGAAAR